jgi:carnitine O-acetyltransferase
MRPVTPEALAFIGAMEDRDGHRESRLNAFRAACEAHVRRIQMCKEGMGVDRHLFGLLRVFRREGPELGLNEPPGIFRDRGWKILNHNRISTSTTSSLGLVLAGYAPVVDDGLGLRYMTKPEAINFNVTARSGHVSQLDQMTGALESALLELADLFS